MGKKFKVYASKYSQGRMAEGRFSMIHAPDEQNEPNAVLVVTDERVFTESEVMAAAMAEDELPDDMPDEMWEACRSDRATMQEAMRVVVRLTRDGILSRLLDPA